MMLLCYNGAIGFAIGTLDNTKIPDPDEKLKILTEHHVREHIIDRSFDRPDKCPLRANLNLWGLHSRLSAISESLKYGECYNRNKNTIEGFEKLLDQKNSFFPAYHINQESPPSPDSKSSK